MPHPSIREDAPLGTGDAAASGNGGGGGVVSRPLGKGVLGLRHGAEASGVSWASSMNIADMVSPPDQMKGSDPDGGAGSGTDEDGRDSNKPGTYEFLKYNQRHLTSEVLFCASMGNLRRLKMVLTRAEKSIKSEPFADYDHRTPLHISSSDGSVMVTNWLISQGVDLNPCDRWGMTPLEGAVFGNHQDIIKMLVAAGGKIKDRTTGQLLPIEESHVAGAVGAAQQQVFSPDLMAWEIQDEELSDRKEIGAGAFGIVMRTRWRGTVVAMKQLHRHLHHDEVAKAEFRTELKLMRQLHHPHIVQFLGTSVDAETGLVSLVSEFMHAGSLDNLFRRNEAVSLGQATEMALDVARGMSYLHGRKPLPVIHRDLKPGNLMLTRAKRLKIGDFGLSKTMSVRNKMPQDLNQDFTMTGETGSYRYMAPEVFRHEFYGPAVDVYAASMIFYQLFCFQQPYSGLNPVDAAKLASTEALRPTVTKGLMPAELSRIVRAMWDPHDQKRPTFLQIIDMIEPLAMQYQEAEAKMQGAGQGCGCVVS